MNQNKNSVPVYICNLDFSIPRKLFGPVFPTIRRDKSERIQKFKFHEDLMRGLFGELLLKYVLEKFWNLDYAQLEFVENEFGKPLLKSNSIHFNISHSGDWVVGVCAEFPVGIDIEKIENPPYEIMKQNFTEFEITQIAGAPDSKKAEKFFSIWTAKESYIKMIGTGLSSGLDSFSVDLTAEPGTKIIDTSNVADNVRIFSYFPDEYHILSTCFESVDELSFKIRQVSTRELLRDFVE